MRSILFLTLTALSVNGQISVSNRTDLGAVDASGAASTKPAKALSSLPGVCGTSEQLFLTSAPAGQNLYGCTAPNVWSLQAGGGGGSTQVCVVTRTSTTVLTLATGATSTNPCILNGTNFVSPITFTVGSNGGTIYIYASLTTIIGGYGGGTFGSGNVTCSGCTATFGITAFPNPTDGVVPIWTWTATAGTWNVSGGTKKLQEAGAQNLIQGTNITLTKTSTGLTIDASGGGTPGGSNKELQYNNSGAFGAVGSSDVSGTNFIVPRNGTFGANGRAVIGQNGSGDTLISTNDHFSNGFNVTTEPNAIGEAIMRFGPLGSTGTVLWYRGAMQLTPGGVKYTCDSTTRGMFFVTNGGAGVKDNVEVCAKDAADAYAWRTIY